MPSNRSKSDAAGRRVLITGAAGLLGSALLRELFGRGEVLRGTDIRLIVADSQCDLQFLQSDLLDEDACRRACQDADVIVHTAALQHGFAMPRWGRRRFFDANVRMTRNLIAAAIDRGVEHVVMVSSDMVYGIPHGRAFRESDVPSPIGPYGRSKLASEAVCEAARQRGVRVTVLRPRLIIGPGRIGVLKRLFDRIRAGRCVPLIGDGRNRYQMVSVADVAAACRLAVEKRAEGVFNLGSDAPVPVVEMIRDVCRRAGSGSRVRPTPAALVHAALWALHSVRLSPLTPEQFRIANVDYVLDTSRAREELGWTPRDSDAEMLWQAYQSYVGAAPVR